MTRLFRLANPSPTPGGCLLVLLALDVAVIWAPTWISDVMSSRVDRRDGICARSPSSRPDMIHPPLGTSSRRS